MELINPPIITIANGEINGFVKTAIGINPPIAVSEVKMIGRNRISPAKRMASSKGFASKEIADKLFLSINTVNNHRQNILEKIKASNTSEAVSYARNLGLL